MESNKVFDVVLLMALPASGKSEIRNFMANIPEERLRKEFHIGQTIQLDDFPYVHMMRRIDDELMRMGEPRVFYPGEAPLIDGRDWQTLCNLLSEDYMDIRNRNAVTTDSAARLLFVRIDRAAMNAGFGPRLGLIRPEILDKLAGCLEDEARAMLNEKNAAYPSSFENKTIVIECARGGPDKSDMPLTGTFGYQFSLPKFCPEILEKAVILYIWVTPEESRRKNNDRADPNDPGSNLHHGVPEAVMYGDYGCDDIAYLMEHSEVPDTLTVRAYGRTYHIPIGVVDNRADMTSFLREPPETWEEGKVEAVVKALKKATDTMYRG